MLIFGFCEGVFFLRRITITVDDVTLDRLCAMRELNGVPYSAAIRLAVLSYYQVIKTSPRSHPTCEK